VFDIEKMRTLAVQNATRNAVATAVALALLPFSSFGSSHREAPNITKLPAVDSTDFTCS
jgi:hypothetical protein